MSKSKTKKAKVDEIERMRQKLFGPPNGDKVDEIVNHMARALARKAFWIDRESAGMFTEEKFKDKIGCALE